MKDIGIALRNLKRNRVNTAIIFISLSLGFACLNLITTFLSHELRTDNFHADKDRIYSVISDDPFHKGNKSYCVESKAMEYIKSNFTMVEDVCTYRSGSFGYLELLAANKSFTERPNAIETSPNFFNFFSYPLLIGNPKTVLENSNGIVISDELAQKLFGNESAIGKTIDFKIIMTVFQGEGVVNSTVPIKSSVETKSELHPYTITGIFKKPEQNSLLDFDMVLNFKFNPEIDNKGYIKLARSANAEEVKSLFAKYKTVIPITSGEIQGQYYLKSLKETYFDTTRSSLTDVEKSQSKTTIWIVASIGLLIMVLAMFNFLGIVNHNLLERAKNYSIYQLNGANKIQLTRAVLAEILLLLIPSFLLGLAIMNWILPFFNQLINTSIDSVHALQLFNLGLLALVLLVIFIIVSIFVIYKLNSIAGYSALNGIRTNLKFQLPALNVFQLSVTIMLITASLIIIKQIRFINNRAIGTDMQVINIAVPLGKGNKLEILKTKLLQFPSIQNASISTSSLFWPHRMLLEYNKDEEKHSFTSTNFSADENFIETLGIKIIKGHGFSDDPTQNRNTCLINESMAKKLNIKDLTDARIPGSEMPVIGIVEDFNFESLKSTVSPAFIDVGLSHYFLASNIFIKTSDTGGEQSLNDIKQAWKEIFPDTPFHFETIEQQYLKLNADNNKTIQLVILCCFVSILLSMMGLFAVVLQNSKLRTKEIGIRKVNGARISEILALLNRDFVKWVAIAFVIATPIAYYAMHKWLESFAYKTSLSWWIFALAGLLALGIALLTVSIQSWKAATRNPVEALRYE